MFHTININKHLHPQKQYIHICNYSLKNMFYRVYIYVSACLPACLSVALSMSQASDRSSPSTGKSSQTAGQSSRATYKANETVLDDKLESMNEDVNEMEPGCEIAPAETDEKEVSVTSDRKAVSSDGKDDLVSQLPQDFIAPTAKKKELYVPEKCQLKIKYGGFKHGEKPQGPLSKRRIYGLQL